MPVFLMFQRYRNSSERDNQIFWWACQCQRRPQSESMERRGQVLDSRSVKFCFHHRSGWTVKTTKRSRDKTARKNNFV